MSKKKHKIDTSDDEVIEKPKVKKERSEKQKASFLKARQKRIENSEIPKKAKEFKGNNQIKKKKLKKKLVKMQFK